MCTKTTWPACTAALSLTRTPIAQMDYGVRVYSANEVVIKDNRFGTLFNHVISLKSLVTLATITGNTFTDNRTGLYYFVAGACGSTAVPATITGNSFDGGPWGFNPTLAKIGVRWNEAGGPRPNDLTAECNWWGHVAGPNSTGAPGCRAWSRARCASRAVT